MGKIVQIVSHHGMLFALDERGTLWAGHFSPNPSGAVDLDALRWVRVSFHVEG